MDRTRLEARHVFIVVPLGKRSILPYIKMRVPPAPTIGIDVAFVGGTQGMTVVENIVEAQTATEIGTFIMDGQILLDVHERLAIKHVVILLLLIALIQTII